MPRIRRPTSESARWPGSARPSSSGILKNPTQTSFERHSNVTSALTTAWPEFLATDSELEVISKISRFYGSDPSIVLAGGGNTSCKVGDRLYVKASGTSLATMTPDGFVAMDRPRLEALAGATLDSDPDTREAQFKSAISEARCEPQKGQRPSVEVLLHHLLPGTFVVHSHATIANALTCHVGGQRLTEELFGNSVIWLPYVDPGFTLAQTLQQTLDKHRQRNGQTAVRAILMANHGLIVAGDSPAAIRANTDEVLSTIANRLGDAWESKSFGEPAMSGASAEYARRIGPLLRGLLADGDAASLKVATFDE